MHSAVHCRVNQTLGGADPRGVGHQDDALPEALLSKDHQVPKFDLCFAKLSDSSHSSEPIYSRNTAAVKAGQNSNLGAGLCHARNGPGTPKVTSATFNG